MTNQAIAFFIGFFGSVHCVGMCSPLIFSVPTFKTQRFFMFTDKLVYQLGRVFTYTLLGFIFGLIGQQIWVSSLQNSLSVLTGIFILIAGLMRVFQYSPKISLPLFASVNALLLYAYQHRANHLIIGILNGFLPCGLVYMALAGALNVGGGVASATYMFWFGLGTTPLVLLAAVGVGFLQPYYKLLNARVLPVFMIVLGVWFVLRGLQLNIPYLSPAPLNSSQINCS